MNRPTLRADVDRAATLYDEEVRLREWGRQRELAVPDDPLQMAGSYFRAAAEARRERLELLRRCALI